MSVFGTTSTIQLDTIVFATDFSPASHNAGLYASAVSMRLLTKLVVAHGFTLVQAAREAELITSKPSTQRSDLDHDLALVAEILDAGQGATEAVLLAGDPCKAIPEFAQSRHPSLIVLGTHGGGKIDHFVLGSTAEGVLRNSAGAALTIGPKVNILRAGSLNIQRILYATDCSPEAAHAAPVAIALAEAFGAELDVLNVVHPRQMGRPEQIQKLQEHFYQAVKSYLPHTAKQVAEPHTFVCVGDPPEQILQHIEERRSDLLVLGLRRSAHLGMQNRTSGAFPIIVAAPCPVVTVALGSAAL
jgi:nucleotide-binding universal stress UspA family protein